MNILTSNLSPAGQPWTVSTSWWHKSVSGGTTMRWQCAWCCLCHVTVSLVIQSINCGQQFLWRLRLAAAWQMQARRGDTTSNKILPAMPQSRIHYHHTKVAFTPREVLPTEGR